MKHQDLWNAIDAMAAENKLSCSAMAIRGGLCSTTFNKSKRVAPGGKERWMSMQSVVKVLDSMNKNMAYFADFVDKMSAAREKAA